MNIHGDTMAKGKIRNSIEDSEQIPFEPPIWFMVIYVDKNGVVQNEAFQANKTDLVNVSELIQTFNKKLLVYKIFGVWTGSWNTDLFEMNIDVMIRRLKEAGHWDFTRRMVK